MRTISNLRGVRQILRIESAHVAIDESRVMEGTFTFDSTMVEGSVFQIGTAVADEINVTVVDPNGELNTYIDETYSVYIAPFNANRSQATWTLIGQYVVAELDTSYSGRAKVKFQDRMVTLDVPVDFQTGTLYANLQNLGLTLSLTQEEITFLSGLSVLNRQTMTKRDFIRGCALLMWENAYLKPDGKLAFRSITTTAQTFTPSDRFSSELGDEVTIGPVRVIDDSGAVIYTMGSASGQTIEISSTTSPMISLIGSIEGLATYYSTATIPGRGIADFSYTPLTMSLLSTWALEPGDVVSYIDKDSNTYTSVVTSVAHVLNGASACTSAGEAKTRQSQQIPKQTDETRVVISQLESGVDEAHTIASEAMPKYGVCSTASGTATKEVNVGTGFVLREGARVAVLMKNVNTATGTLKLKVNSTDAKDIVDSEGNAVGNINGQTSSWLAGSLVTFVYTIVNETGKWRIDDNLALTRINNILTDNLVGTNGWINLKDGKFNYGSGKLVWNGSTLSVNGTIETTTGHIGGWDIGTTVLQKFSAQPTTSGDQYNVFMQAPATPSVGDSPTRAFGVQKRTFTDGTAGSWSNVFYVNYKGKLYAKDAEITGTISGSTITGSTISGTTITGSTITGADINISATGSIVNGTSTYNKYKSLIETVDVERTYTGQPTMTYKSAMLSSEVLNSSSVKQSGSYIYVDPFGEASMYGSAGINLGTNSGNLNTTRFTVASSRVSSYVDFYAPSVTTTGAITAGGTITSNGSICSGGKAAVWDSNAGGIMSAGGILSLRANSSTTPGIYVTAYGSTTTTYDAGFYYNATNTRWQANKQIYATSFLTSGNITAERSDTSTPSITAKNSAGAVALHVAAVGNRGIYDSTDSEWLICKQASDGQRAPVATTAKNGFMSAADKTKLNSITGYTASATTITDKSLSSGTTVQNIGSFKLTAGYWIVYIVCRFASNATGRRMICLSTTSTGDAMDYAAADTATAINGTTTYLRLIHFLHPTAETTYYINGYQNSGSALTVVTRYGAWKILQA